MRRTTAIVALLACLLTAGQEANGQVPAVAGKNTVDPLSTAKRWIDASSFHVARQRLRQSIEALPETESRADELVLLARCAFEDQQYGDAFRWADDFVLRYPHDIRIGELEYIRGVSAFQNGQVEESIESLNTFLQGSEDPVRTAEARFWRAMCRIERGEWSDVETDLAEAYANTSDPTQRDLALMGVALSLDRRGNGVDAAARFEEYLREFPDGRFITEARLRLASVSLRLNNVPRAREVLEGVTPESRREQEEYLFLSSEADLRVGAYDRAADACSRILREFPDHPQERKVRYNLAWSLLQQRDATGALQMFDSLSRGGDSIACTSLYQKGIILLLAGRSKEGVASLDSLVTRSPYDRLADRSYFQMGMAVYRNRQYREAKRYFQFASRMFPESPWRPEAFRMLGETNVAMGDFSNAQYAFSQARKLSTDPSIIAPSTFKEGVALYHLGRFRTAIERLNDYLRKYPRGPQAAEAYVWKGESLYQDGQYEQAERAYADAIRLFPDNPLAAEAAYGVAWAMFEQKRFRQAASAFERFSSKNPQSEFALEASLRTADCYFFLGEYERATSMYNALTSSAGSGAKVEYAAFQIAMSYLQRGEADRGVEKLRDFLKRYPGSVYCEVAQFNIGWTYFSAERYAEAITELRTVMAEYPQSQLLPRVLFNLGDAFYNEKSYDSARTYYQALITRYPSSPLVQDALNGLQYTYEAEGKPGEALKVIEQFMESGQGSGSKADLLVRKGDILFGQGDFGNATAQYEQALALDPDTSLLVRVLHQLGRSCELENNPGRAATYYERLIARFPNADVAPAVTLALGQIYMKAKQYPRASTVLDGFETRYAGSQLMPEVRYLCGVALLNSGDRRGAAERFGLVISSAPAEIFADRSRLQIAAIHQTGKEYKAAIDTLEGIIGKRNDDLAAEALLLLGDTYVQQKNTRAALQAYKDVIDQYTEFGALVERARFGAGECYERLKERANARKEYEELVRSALDPGMKKKAEDKLKRLRR